MLYSTETARHLTRYTEPHAIWAALRTGHVRLPKASYLAKLGGEGGVLRRRQELEREEPEAFISVEELERMYGEGNHDGVLPILSISFCWDTAPHPDPRGKQLATVAAALKREMPKYAELGFSEMGVFWDWASIDQKDPRLFDPSETPEAKPEGPERNAFIDDLKAGRSFYGGAAYEASRSEEEKAAFRYALHETMDLWYAHQGTTVYMLTELPEGTQRKAGYDDSGWTTYERRSAEQIKKVYLVYAKWKLVLDLGAGKGAFDSYPSLRSDVFVARNWPLDPDGFDKLIEGKQFTNGADKGAVKALFRRMSVAQLGGIKELIFTKLSPPTVEDAQQLGRCLSLCHQLEKCDLAKVKMTGDACAALFSSLASGTLGSLQKLNLRGNQIGDAGMNALAGALASGSLGSLKELNLSDNEIGDAGVSALAGAVASGSLGSLTGSKLHVGLGLGYNQVGDAGMIALSRAIASGSMANLRVLGLTANKISDAGMSAFAEAVRSGSLAALQDLRLDDNMPSESGMKAIYEAAEKRSIKCSI
mmetsp:Transcript_30602/g.98301  ORF Transcript_30602/g.98301 Transcript_30602/m.98301 type:complete len:534 (+) Transcript_30602:116-1717(+)